MSWSRPISRLLLAGAAIAAIGIALATVWVAPAAMARWRGPIGEAAAPLVMDMCADRRPDGTLPAACGNDAGDASLLFVGDTAEADAALPTLAARGFEFPFSLTLDLLHDADLAVFNQEAPIGDRGRPFPFGKQYIYRAPGESAGALAAAGFDVAGLANNHAFDYGAEGLLGTLDQLAQAKIAGVGGGASEASARRGVVIQLGALRVGILARCQRDLDWDLWVHQFAAGDRPGVAALDDSALARDVAALRAKADLVIVLIHWGSTYEPPTNAQLAWAERASQSGADLIVGHHPHLAQPLLIAKVKHVPVALSLGNYAFGTVGSPELDVGLMLRAVVRARRLTRLELIPIDVQNRRVGYRPTPLKGPAAAAALAPLIAQSRALGATGLRMENELAVLDLAAPAASP